MAQTHPFANPGLLKKGGTGGNPEDHLPQGKGLDIEAACVQLKLRKVKAPFIIP